MARPLSPVPTKRQQKVLDWIKAYTARQGVPPAVRDIGQAFHITPRAVFDHLKALERKGLLQRRHGSARSIILTGVGREPAPAAKSIPVIGRIAAGQPIFAAEDTHGEVTVDAEKVLGRDIYALRVEGDSMVDAGILNGDTVLIRRQDTADDGDIVVALLDDQATLKRLRLHGSSVTLEPANRAYQPVEIKSRELRIQGKLVGVQRWFR